jgi:hypothetical protein
MTGIVAKMNSSVNERRVAFLRVRGARLDRTGIFRGRRDAEGRVSDRAQQARSHGSITPEDSRNERSRSRTPRLDRDWNLRRLVEIGTRR